MPYGVHIFLFLAFLFATAPAWAQDRLYPVRGSSGLLTANRSAFVVEKAFQHKLTLGFPDDDNAWYLPDTKAAITVLWLRIQNVSQRPMEVNISKFSTTDDEGRTYSVIQPDIATNRIIEEASGGSIGTKALRGLSMGRVANKPSEEQMKDDLVLHSLHSMQIQPGAVREGLIYFEGPQQKKFTLNVRLGDLWPNTFVFTTEKQK